MSKYQICPSCEGEGYVSFRVQTLFDDDDRGSLVERHCERCLGQRVVPLEAEDVDWGAEAERKYFAMIEDRGY